MPFLCIFFEWREERMIGACAQEYISIKNMELLSKENQKKSGWEKGAIMKLTEQQTIRSRSI